MLNQKTEPKPSREQFNESAEAIEDAQGEIRLIVKNAFLYRRQKTETERKIKEAINRAKKKIKIIRLAEDAERSLLNFANQQMRTWKSADVLPEIFLLFGLTTDRNKVERELVEKSNFSQMSRKPILYETDAKGIPLGQYYKNVWKDKIEPTLQRLSKEVALDPNDFSGRNSLRNLAEMEVRYNGHQEDIAKLREAGERLVVCSAHADCSDRCAPYQGRVYSLNGTRGVTPDGRRYVPLEEATNNPRDVYVTKAGRVYQNGLLGFNCFDDKTEVYTSEGWKKFSELNGEEQFYTIHAETKTVEWQSACNYFRKHYDGNLIQLHSETTDLVVTPDHNLLYYTQKNKTLRFKSAREFTTATFLTAGHVWNGKEKKLVQLGDQKVDGDLYCKFMAYYLADGSRHSNYAVKIAQQNNEKMFQELSFLPFRIWRDDEKIVVYGKELVKDLSRYGTCTEKFVPASIKSMSTRQIRLFLDAYLETDGYRSKPKTINGYLKKPHLSLFTTSKRMADDLGELAMKAGYRPKFDTIFQKGKKNKFRNGLYESKFPLYVIHLNYNVNVTKLEKREIEYHGFVYCVEVPNHTLLVRRNGRVIWCGNCRHKLYPYRQNMGIPTVTAEDRKKEYEITKIQREMERRVRNYRVEALNRKDTDRKGYLSFRAKAAKAYEEYKQFSKQNHRAFYPMRVQI